MCNLYLQDRVPGRTPRWRGVTLAARAAGARRARRRGERQLPRRRSTASATTTCSRCSARPPASPPRPAVRRLAPSRDDDAGRPDGACRRRPHRAGAAGRPRALQGRDVERAAVAPAGEPGRASQRPRHRARGCPTIASWTICSPRTTWLPPMERELLNPSGVHPPQAHYSHVGRVGNTLYISGQLAMDRSGTLVGAGDARAQARQCYDNLAVILAHYGGELRHLVKTTTLHHALGLSPVGGGGAGRGVPGAALSSQHAGRRAGPGRAPLPRGDRGDSRPLVPTACPFANAPSRRLPH